LTRKVSLEFLAEKKPVPKESPEAMTSRYLDEIKKRGGQGYFMKTEVGICDKAALEVCSSYQTTPTRNKEYTKKGEHLKEEEEWLENCKKANQSAQPVTTTEAKQ